MTRDRASGRARPAGEAAPLARIAELYRAAYAAHGDSPAAVFWPKGRQAERFASLVSGVAEEPFSVLDFGCGLGHLLPFLAERFEAFTYTGVDLCGEFIAGNRRRHPGGRFRRIDAVRDVTESYDHVVIAGTFNIRYVEDDAANRRIVFDALSHLFGRARRTLAVNFMTDEVDYVQEGAYHQNVDDLLAFARKHLSRRLILDQSYLPYEFTLTVRKDQEIVRPENIYR